VKGEGKDMETCRPKRLRISLRKENGASLICVKAEGR
jgi:hypothetical protein